MYTSLRALVTHLIDYAGLFPPAELPLEPALRNYARYRSGPDAWMLGRFIFPAVRLPDNPALIDHLAGEAPLTFSALGRRAPDSAAFTAALAADLALIRAARTRHPQVVVDVLELALPPGAPAPTLLAELAERAAAAGLRVFCETGAPVDEGWVAATQRLAAALAEHNAAGGPPLGLKLRTGGVIAAAFPTPAQLAAALVAARDGGLALKCTAGLHHPFRQHRAEVGTHMHGFVNVFVAGVLAHRHGLDTPRVAAILADERPGAFQFDGEGLAWGELRAPTAAVVALRDASLIAYGSCSFDEPRDDLRDLGLLG